MSGIYIHIPFCKQRCIYCDFYSTSLHSHIDKYVECVIKEARMRPLSDVATVYIGGGTPSQLPPEQFKRLVCGLGDTYDLSQIVEFTVEVNPDDVTLEYMRMLYRLGVNRISMGVQSFIDEELITINRRHDSQAAQRAVECIKQAGINNLSLDLIYGIPGQTLESWGQSIKQAQSTGAQHISAYNLTYEAGTKLWQMREQGRLIEVDEPTCVEMYTKLTTMMREAGYEHYEISNFGLRQFHSRHNSSYWNRTPYIGLGASAHSYDGNQRSYNPASIHDYIAKIDDGQLASEVEDLEWYEQYDEAIMVALRTSKGINLADIKREFGSDVCNYLLSNATKLIDSKLLVKEGSRLYIREEDYMMSDAIIRELMWDV